MIPRVPEDAFIALLRRVYHNGRHCSRSNSRGLSYLRSMGAVGTRRPSPTTSDNSSSTTDHQHHRTTPTRRHATTTTTTATATTTANKNPNTGAPTKTWSVSRRDDSSKDKRPGPQSSAPKTPRPKKKIAVLGGGITGLTTAHYLARYGGPDVHVTLYEASEHLGGWIDSVRVPAGSGGGDGEVLLQRGPRMLRSGAKSHRYDDLVLYDVIASLNLQSSMRHPVGPSSSRYIFYPDHLVKLPSPADLTSPSGLLSTIQSVTNEPLFDGCFGAGLNLFTKTGSFSGLMPWRVDDRLESSLRKQQERWFGTGKGNNGDESVGAFLTRLFGGDDRPVRNLVSAVLHGIYGGDAWRLSAKHTILDRLWYQAAAPRPKDQVWMPRKDWFLLFELMDGGGPINANADAIVAMAERAVDGGWSLLAFEDGLVTLVRALVKDLQTRANVEVRMGTKADGLVAVDDGVVVKSSSKTAAATGSQSAQTETQYDHVISTLFSKDLAELAQPAGTLPSLAETHAVTIMVVNLWYPGQDLLAHNHGFGYLVPSSTPNNDEGTLGVLFDSDLDPMDPAANPNPTTTSESKPQPHPAGTKLTVMLGGHHWDGWRHFPTEEAGIAMARAAVHKHLGIDPDPAVNPVEARAKLCRDCLPQHFVGHRGRMAAAHEELTHAFKGRLSVAGPSYTTVGVIPAMRAGWEAALKVVRPGRAALWSAPVVGGSTQKDGDRRMVLASGKKITDGMLVSWMKWWGRRLFPTLPDENVMLSVNPVARDGGGAVTEEVEKNKTTTAAEHKEVQQPPLSLQRHTGLEEFAEPEISTMIPVLKSDLYFRSWTNSYRRLKTDDNNHDGGDDDDVGGSHENQRHAVVGQEVQVIEDGKVWKGPSTKEVCRVVPPRNVNTI